MIILIIHIFLLISILIDIYIYIYYISHIFYFKKYLLPINLQLQQITYNINFTDKFLKIQSNQESYMNMFHITHGSIVVFYFF